MRVSTDDSKCGWMMKDVLWDALFKHYPVESTSIQILSKVSHNTGHLPEYIDSVA